MTIVAAARPPVAPETPPMPEEGARVQSLPVFLAGDFRVTNGANLGDELGNAAELMAGDVYGLTPRAPRPRLMLAQGDRPRRFHVVAGSEAGTPGHEVHLDCALTFMCADGSTVESLVFVEVTESRDVAACYLLPLGSVLPKRDYALIAIDRKGARAKLAQIACVSFARDTRITLADGRQEPIQNLVVGDRVLTRDNGPQVVRWIGRQTVRATGPLAPIRIRKGALNNSGDLLLSPNHLLFVYQRRDRIRAGRAEVLVRARQLVNGTTVVRSDGGFVEYFQILFDQHEIIYAEGIAAESLLVDAQVREVVPPPLRVRANIPEPGNLRRLMVRDGMIAPAVAAELLRSASAC